SPLHVPWSPLHLLLWDPCQRLPAVGGEPPDAAHHRCGHDPLHDQPELLPSRPRARVPGLEEGSVRWRSRHGVLLFLPPRMCVLPVVVSLLHFVSNIPVEQQGVKRVLALS
ncbi:hypothetical protein KUDE01_018012, partial [Dissostichus eleginoides]